jgi:hypothetical protein
MKSSQIEILFVVLIAGYDLISLPFNSFIITLIIAILSYVYTKSNLFVASVFVVPQIIRLMNSLIPKNESFVPKNAEEVINTVKKFKENSNIESFVPKNAEEVINTVKKFKENSNTESFIPDNEEEDDELEGTVESLKFLEQFDNLTDINENQRINTVNETAIPAMPTIINKNRPTAAIEPYDNRSINTALLRSTNTNKQ